jgi:hypothetical protein
MLIHRISHLADNGRQPLWRLQDPHRLELKASVGNVKCASSSVPNIVNPRPVNGRLTESAFSANVGSKARTVWRCLALERRRAQKETTLTFQVRNAYRYQAQIEFYSRARAVSWPGSGRAYDLNDREVHIYDLRCVAPSRSAMGRG